MAHLVARALLGLAVFAQVTHSRITENSLVYANDTQITENTVWSGTVYLNAQVFVKSGATLTIVKGTDIICYYTPSEPKHQPSNVNQAHQATYDHAALLMIERGAKIMAEGTMYAPITFRSIEVNISDPSDREVGTWGGVIILGNAPVTGCGHRDDPHAGEEGIVEAVSNPGLANPSFGGPDANDNSGTMTYVRIWFAGAQASPNREINGLTLGGVGSGTTLHHIEVAYDLDDGLQILGGNVDMSYVSLLYNRDDQLDIDCGYQGRIQFLFAAEAVGYGDHAYNIHDRSSNCISTDDSCRRTAPRISHATILGPGSAGGYCQHEDDQLIRIENGAGGIYTNHIVAFSPRAGEVINSNLTVATGDFAQQELFVKYYYYHIEDTSGLAGGIEITDWDDVCMPEPCTASTDLAVSAEKFAPGLAQLGSLDYDIIPGFAAAAFPGAFAPGVDTWLIGWSLLESYSKLETQLLCGDVFPEVHSAAAHSTTTSLWLLIACSSTALTSLMSRATLS